MELQLSKCEYCGRAFTQKRRWQRFCRSLCRVRRWNRQHPRLVDQEIRVAAGNQDSHSRGA
jgi:hypothetical protein